MKFKTTEEGIFAGYTLICIDCGKEAGAGATDTCRLEWKKKEAKK